MKKFFLLLLTGCLFVTSLAQQTVTPASALDAYLNNGDPTWAWEVRENYQTGNIQAFSIALISQKWQGILWKHELTVFIPEKINHDGALLFITGGSLENGIPRFVKPDDNLSLMIAHIASNNQAVTAILRQTPNQPLFGGLTEDALISYTLNAFRKDGNYSWPLLFPMVKSAQKSMDVIQEFIRDHARVEINRFVVSGASKRGWTTWLTGASRDPRVAAIAPMVIDILNMPATLADQKKDYNYSEEISDYVALELPQAINSEFGNAIIQMIDPYAYRTRLSMPKMLFMGTNDPYWTIDAVKHYIDDIPGKNLLCYISNVGHNLGDGRKAFASLNAFFGMTINHKPYPVFDWTLTEKSGKITLEISLSDCQPKRMMLWSAESDSRDFRKSVWSDKAIVMNKKPVTITLPYPKKGFSAFYVEVVCEDSKGNDFSLTTRPYVADTKKVFVK